MASAKECLPDVHLKMSKKIAQLTKVIYHLNTKNEDHQAAINSLGVAHKSEMEEILSDAAAKLNKFKDELSKRKTQKAVHAELTKLKKQHKAEKAEAMKAFECFKTTVVTREEDAKGQYRQKVKAMQAEVDAMKEKFAQKLKRFKSMAGKHKALKQRPQRLSEGHRGDEAKPQR